MPLKTSVLFLLLLSLIAQAKVSEAKRAYLDGQFNKAQLLFRHAANQELGSKRYRLRFAEAAAAYRQKKFNQAAKAYAESLRADDPQFRKQAHYNLANTLTREGQQQLEQALSHYDDALQLQAKDKLTQENRSHLEKLIEELKKEQEQNQEDNKDENQNQEQQDQQKNDQEDGEDQQDQENAENQEQGDDQEEQSSQNQESNQPSQENQNQILAKNRTNKINKLERTSKIKRTQKIQNKVTVRKNKTLKTKNQINKMLKKEKAQILTLRTLPPPISLLPNNSHQRVPSPNAAKVSLPKSMLAA